MDKVVNPTTKTDRTPQNPLRSDMPRLDAIAPIIWAKWGRAFLEVIRQKSLDAADGLAFRAMNSDQGSRTLLIACTINRMQIQATEEVLQLKVIAHPADWENYSAAEMLFKTEQGSGPGHQELRDRNARTAVAFVRDPSGSSPDTRKAPRPPRMRAKHPPASVGGAGQLV